MSQTSFVLVSNIKVAPFIVGSLKGRLALWVPADYAQYLSISEDGMQLFS